MRRQPIAAALALLVLVLACSTSPLGRKQLRLVPEDQMAEMGVSAFAEISAEMPHDTDPGRAATLRCVTDALVPLAVAHTGIAEWEIVIFAEPSPNAFALPGGKIGVHSGLFDVARTPGQLAAVIGHELGHVIAHHGNERVSTAMAAQAGMGLAEILSREKSDEERQQLLMLLGLGAQLGVILPYSRSHEREADLIGLDLMAEAGFDPRESVDLWENMVAAAGAGPPEFLSTHPSGESRIRDLGERMGHANALMLDAHAAGHDPDCH